MSLQLLFSVAVKSFPKKKGSSGLLISIKAVPSSKPLITYSFPVSGSVQPQLSFPELLPNSSREMRDKRSYPKQGYTPAIPFSQGTFPLRFTEEFPGITVGGVSKETGSIISVLKQETKKSVISDWASRFMFFFKIK